MNGGMNNSGAAAGSCNMKYGGGYVTSFSKVSLFFHVAAGRCCARAVHAAIHATVENDVFDNISGSICNITNC